MGWPAAALALAKTYDPHELAGLQPPVIPDPRPDLKEARSWYLRAQELANARINFFLKRLEPATAAGLQLPDSRRGTR